MENTSGFFFGKPFSQSKNGNVLGSSYRKIVRRQIQNDESDYPVFVVIGPDYVSFYCNTYRAQNIGAGADNLLPTHYGIGLIFSFSFAQGDSSGITQLFQNTGFLYPDNLDSALYISWEEGQNILSYSNLSAWEELPRVKSKRKKSEQKKQSNDLTESIANEKGILRISFRELVLDFLFDLFHSNVFRRHPAVMRLKAALNNASLAHAVCTKANYYYSRETIEALKKQATTDQQKLSWKEKRMRHATQEWLALLRMPSTEKVIAYKPDTGVQWFEDIESEHKAVFGVSRDENRFLAKESEDSIQWLIGRYNFIQAYWMQWEWIYTNKWRIIIPIVAIFIAGGYIFKEFLFGESACKWWGKGFLWIFLLLLAFSLALIMERLIIFIASLPNLIRKVKNKWFIKSEPGDILLSIPKIIQFNSPKILLASTVAWAWIEKNVWKEKVILSLPYWVVAGGLLVLIGMCIAFTIAKLSPLLPMKNTTVKGWHLFGRAWILLLLSCIYSFIIGIFVAVVPLLAKPSGSKNLADWPQYLCEISMNEYWYKLAVLVPFAAIAGILLELGTRK